jgi:choline transport protein
LNNPSYIPKA